MKVDLSEVKKLEQATKPLDEAGELLMVAASLIEQRGLERRAFTNGEGGLCVQGALATAAGYALGSLPERSAAQAANQRLGKLLGEAPYRWIQYANVSPEMVVAKMREAALL